MITTPSERIEEYTRQGWWDDTTLHALLWRNSAAHPDREDLRWRVEHAQHLALDDVPRFAALGVPGAASAKNNASPAAPVAALCRIAAS